jgi:NADH dehydrogenase
VEKITKMKFSRYNTAMILVTGGTGFVGRVLIRQLRQAGYQVRTLLRPSPKSPNLPQGVPVDVVLCSLNDARGLRAAMKGVKVVYHLAGSERLSTRADLNKVDIAGTEAVAQAASQAGVEKLIFLSHLGADRQSAFALLKAKAIAEHLIQQSGVPYVILRSAVVYGPGDAFTEPLAWVLRRSPGFFLLPNDGRSLIQPLWIEDLVTCMVMAVEDEQLVGQVISLGGIEALSIHQVVKAICQQLGLRRLLLNLPVKRLRSLALLLEQSGNFPLSIYWMDYLSYDRTCPLDSLPRQFGLLPARFHQQLGYLK